MTVSMQSLRKIAFAAATLLSALELATGTSFEFAMHLWWASLLVISAVFLVGGTRSISGVALCGIFVSDLGLPRVAKILFGQPADSHLQSPELLSQVYLAGAISLFAAAAVFRALNPQLRRSPCLIDPSDEQTMDLVVKLGYVMTVNSVLLSVLQSDSRILSGVIAYLNSFAYVGLCAGVALEVQRSGGRRFLSFRILVQMLLLTAVGLVGFWKEAMMKPIAVVALTAVFYKVRFEKRHIVAAVSVAIAFVSVILPLASLGHDFTYVTYGRIGVFDLIVALVDDVTESGGLGAFLEQARAVEAALDSAHSYYGSSKGFLDRLTITKMADNLLSAVDSFGPLGLDKFYQAAAVLPRSLTDTPIYISDNAMARWVGLVHSDDYETGIAFGLFAAAFAYGGFPTVFGLCFSVPLLVFVSANRFLGSMDRNWVAIGLLWLCMPIFMGASIDAGVFFVFRMIPFHLGVIFALVFVARTFRRRAM